MCGYLKLFLVFPWASIHGFLSKMNIQTKNTKKLQKIFISQNLQKILYIKSYIYQLSLPNNYILFYQQIIYIKIIIASQL